MPLTKRQPIFRMELNEEIQDKQSENTGMHGNPMEGDTKVDNSTGGLSRLRMAAWVGAALFLVAIAVSMQFSAEVDWSVGDFVFAGILLFGSLGVYELVVRTAANRAYRAGFGLAIVATLLLIWINGAVGITDSGADQLYLVVVAVGVAGAFIARFRPYGMAVATLATALALTCVGVGALLTGIVPAFNTAFEVLGITGFFVVLYLASAFLFRQAAR